MPIALNEISTRPALSITDCRCPSMACSSRASTSAASADPPAGRRPWRQFRRCQLASGQEQPGPLGPEGACDSTTGRASGSVDHRNLVLEHHLWLLPVPGWSHAHLISCDRRLNLICAWPPSRHPSTPGSSEPPMMSGRASSAQFAAGRCAGSDRFVALDCSQLWKPRGLGADSRSSRRREWTRMDRLASGPTPNAPQTVVLRVLRDRS